MKDRTLVLGASTNPDRYSNIAIHRLLAKNINVAAVGNNEGEISGIPVYNTKKMFKSIHTITLYLNAKNQQNYYDYIVSLKPERVIFNPGTENLELEKTLTASNISFERSCTLVLLSLGAY